MSIYEIRLSLKSILELFKVKMMHTIFSITPLTKKHDLRLK